MLIRKGYKFRLNTSPSVEAVLRPFAGCNRFLWNKALAMQKEQLDKKQGRLSYSRLCKLLPDWKKEHPLLSDAPSQALQQTLKSLAGSLSETFDPSNLKSSPCSNESTKAGRASVIHRDLKSAIVGYFCLRLDGWVEQASSH